MMSKLKSEWTWLKHDLGVWCGVKFSSAWKLVPMKIRHTVLAWEVGSLSTTNRLRQIPVPSITVQDLIDAIGDRERGVDHYPDPSGLYRRILLLPATTQEIAEADLVIGAGGVVTKDRYGPDGRMATDAEINHAVRGTATV